METTFRDKTVIVTGAGHGFGRAIAHAFAVRGAWVFGCDINEEALAMTARDAPAGDRLSVGRLDVTDRAAVRTYVDAAQARTGAVDILVNNAGGVLGLVGQPIEAVAAEDWQALVDVNMTAVFAMVQAVAAAMKAKGVGPRGQHLERRRAALQPDRHSSLRCGQGRADRPHPPARVRAGTLRHHRQQRRARLRSLQPGERASVARDEGSKVRLR